jgi:septal ring-binding cell division protein DamX
VDEPRTHYQISLTSGQAAGAFILFVVLLLASYFLGLLTGLSGRGEKAPPRVGAAAALTPTPEPAFPKPVLGVAPRGGRPAPSPSPAPEPSPGPTTTIQLFSDGTASEPTHAPAAAKSTASKPAGKPTARPTEGAGFWVQVDSLSSKDQAESRRQGLAAAGFKATIVPGSGPKGPVYRIRTGPYATREDAERAATKLAEKAKVKRPWVVPPGQ